MRRPRRNHAPAFKAKGALATIEGTATLAELAQRFDVHPEQITEWRRQLVALAADAFGGPSERPEPAINVKTLHAQIGQQALDLDLLSNALGHDRWFAGLSSGKR